MDIVYEFMPFAALLFALVIGHAVADYAMQNDFVAQAKNHTTELGKLYWKWVLPSHGLIHAGFVFAITGSFVLGLLEFIAHTVIDYLKCDNRISFNVDQWLHVLCKVIYVVLITYQVPFIVE